MLRLATIVCLHLLIKSQNCYELNMQISDISFWGVGVAVMLMAVMVGLFYVIDRRMLSRIFRVLAYVGASLAVTALVMWAGMSLDSWWADLLWVLFVGCTVSFLILRKAHLSMKSFYLPLALSVLAGLGISVGTMFLLTPVAHSLLILSVMGVVAGQMFFSVSLALKTYVSSLRHTTEHYQYMLANGASHVEAIMPSVRRSLRASLLPLFRNTATPLVVGPPLFFCGLLMGNVSPLSAAVIVFVLMMLVWTSCVGATLLTIILADRSLFDASGRFVC